MIYDDFEALERYLSSLRERRPIAPTRRGLEYPALADAALAGGLSSSSAQGEHPKFTALVEGERRMHVIVKFSPRRTSPVGQRWADLLVAEHVAHEHLAANGIAASRSTLFDFGMRTFLEVERFDRIGAEGRRGVVSLLALDASRYGQLDRWSSSATRLQSDRLLSRGDVDRVRLLEAFSMLIANTDRHFGNLTLFDRYQGRFELAPAYDVLPMLFAPQSDQILERRFEPPDPTGETLSVWPRAQALAEAYWALSRAIRGSARSFARCAPCAARRSLRRLGERRRRQR
ncbi:MAG: HipA domain-containing protein [Steroidobacteraceae bacterium]